MSQVSFHMYFMTPGNASTNYRPYFISRDTYPTLMEAVKACNFNPHRIVAECYELKPMRWYDCNGNEITEESVEKIIEDWVNAK